MNQSVINNLIELYTRPEKQEYADHMLIFVEELKKVVSNPEYNDLFIWVNAVMYSDSFSSAAYPFYTKKVKLQMIELKNQTLSNFNKEMVT